MIGKKIGYILFLGIVYLFKIMPFRVMYSISGFLNFIFCNIIQYRKEVILLNLKKCFPEKDEKEIKELQKAYYKSFTDLLLETIKGFTMTREQLRDRFRIINRELADKHFEGKKNIIMVLGHFANWEWATATLVDCFKNDQVVLYKPMTNQYIDQFIIKSRSRFGLGLASIYNTGQYFGKANEKPVSIYMIADQYPPNKSKQKVVDFFYSKTPFLHGPERYSKVFDCPVIYLEIRREKRGYYTMELFEITEFPKTLAENELTQIYASYLENSIKKQPENWVWSHKRWKKELYSFD